MRSIIVSGDRHPEDMKLHDGIDREPGAEEVRVKVRYAGVNFMDIGTRTNAYATESSSIATPGVEGMGIVDSVGSEVQGFRPGDRVAWYFHWGSYADTVFIPACSLVPVPDDIEDDIAAGLLMQGLTAHHLATRGFPVEVGQVCLVHAASGGVGALLTQIIMMRGGTVIGRVSSDDKVSAAQEAGAGHVLIGRDGHFRNEVLTLTQGRGVNAVFDAIGKVTYEDSIASLAPHGTFVSFGTASGAVAPIDLTQIPKSVFITYSTVMDHTPDQASLLRHAQELFDWVRTGALKIRIERIYPLEDAGRAHADLESRCTTGKLLLQP
ncbi:quinone oxidoreductase [soil metagenome]